MQEENLNLVEGTNIELVRTGNDVSVNCVYEFDPSSIEEQIETISGEVSTIETNVGNLSSLTTTVKTSVVGAINEVNANKENESNKVTTISSSSTNTQYPSAKAVYDSQALQDTAIDNLDTKIDETKEDLQAKLENTKAELDTYKTIFNALPKVEGEGESITLDNTANSVMKINPKGQYKQTATTGKNLFNKYGSLNDGGGRPNTVSLNSQGQIVTIANYSEWRGRGQLIENLSTNTDYTISGTLISATGNANNNAAIQALTASNAIIATLTIAKTETKPYQFSLTFNTGENTSVLTSFSGNDTDTSSRPTTIFDNIQFEEGNAATDYEEYTGGQPSPSPDFPQQIHEVSGDNEVVVCGRNITDISKYLGGSMNTTGVISPNSGISSFTNSNGVITFTTTIEYRGTYGELIKIMPNTDYTISYKISPQSISNGAFIYWYDENQNCITREGINGTRTSPNNAKYARLFIFLSSSGTASISELQLEPNSSATTFEAYNEDTYELDLGVENLFDKNNIVDDSLYNPDGTINTSNSYFRTDDYTYCHNMEYLTISGCVETGGNVIYYDENKNYVDYFSFRDRTLTIPNNVYYYRFGSRKENKDTLQLEFSSKANSYSPFGQTPIKMRGIGTYEDYFVRNSGKNLWNKVTVSNGYINADGTLSSTQSDSYVTSDFIPVKPNETYYQLDRGTPRAKFYDINKELINTTSYQDISIGGVEGSFTIPNNVYYMRVSIYQTTITNDKMMLNEGSTALPYEPFGSGKWCKYNAIEQRILNGTENWSIQATWSAVGNKTNAFYITKPTEINQQLPCYCDYLKYVQPTTIVTTDEYGISYSASLILRMPKSITDGNALNTYLANNNMKMCYVLSTPYSSLIENETLINQLDAIEKALGKDGQTNISQINNDAPFKIYASALKKISGE